MCFKANFQELFKLLKWTINAIEVHWRTLYSYGVWIPADAARVAVESGFSMMDARQCKHAVMSSVCAPLISCPTTSKIYITETPSHWPSQVGYAELGKKTAKVGMPMFRLRPKCHMEVHIVWLGCNITSISTQYRQQTGFGSSSHKTSHTHTTQASNVARAARWGRIRVQSIEQLAHAA